VDPSSQASSLWPRASRNVAKDPVIADGFTSKIVRYSSRKPLLTEISLRKWPGDFTGMEVDP